jgi:hypothetical protein
MHLQGEHIALGIARTYTLVHTIPSPMSMQGWSHRHQEAAEITPVEIATANNRFHLRMNDQVTRNHKWFPELQWGATKRYTYHDFMGDNFKAHTYLENMENESNTNSHP